MFLFTSSKMNDPSPRSSLQRRNSLGNLGLNFNKSPVFYNLLTCILLIAVSCALFGGYIILSPFLKPLFWALLCGSFLHPLKFKIRNKMETCIGEANNPDILPVVISVTCFPIIALVNFSEFVRQTVVTYCWHLLITTCVIAIFLFIPETVVTTFWLCCYTSFQWFMVLFDIFSHGVIFLTLLVSLVVTAYMVPSVERYFLVTLSIVTWFTFLCCIVNVFGVFRLPLLILALALVLYSILFDDEESAENVTVEQPKAESTPKESPKKGKLSSPKKILTQLSMSEDETGTQSGNVYIYWVAISCLCMMLIKLWWSPLLILIVVLTIVVTRCYSSLGIKDTVENALSSVNDSLTTWRNTEMGKIFIPDPVIKIYKSARVLKLKFFRWLLASVDSISAVVVICALIVFVTLAFIFLTTQIYMEGMYLVKVTTAVLNETMLYNPELIHILPKDWKQQLDSTINNAYMYGREALSKAIRGMMSDAGSDKTAELEHVILELWDRIYQAWFITPYDSSTHGPKVTKEAVYQVWDKFKSPEIGMNAVVIFVQNNMALLTAALTSLWEFIKDNIGLAMYLLGTVLSIVIMSGFTVLSFFISVVVFLTTLFYLLSSSRTYYKPVEFIRDVSPSYGTKLALAIERSVTEVFTVSLKLALFYGLYTWLLHNLFEMSIVYIPTVCAAIFAAVPVVSTYWVCLPGVFDLWLIRGNRFSALILFLLQFAPTNVVDSAIYEDIHGGHPLLTGLSLAGGVISFGVQGAIIGPLILCCMLVMVRFCTALLKEPNESSKT